MESIIQWGASTFEHRDWVGGSYQTWQMIMNLGLSRDDTGKTLVRFGFQVWALDQLIIFSTLFLASCLIMWWWWWWYIFELDDQMPRKQILKKILQTSDVQKANSQTNPFKYLCFIYYLLLLIYLYRPWVDYQVYLKDLLFLYRDCTAICFWVWFCCGFVGPAGFQFNAHLQISYGCRKSSPSSIPIFEL